MPPKKGIVRSGNAGNSSKSSNARPRNNDWKKAADVYAEPPKEAPKLFPDGYKFPLSLLQERYGSLLEWMSRTCLSMM